MNHNNELRDRMKQFALRIIKLTSSIPKSREGDVIAKQVLRSGTSPGAQFREAFRAKSDADYVSKLEGANQELDETQYWLELLGESGIVPQKRLTLLHQEAGELLAIVTSIVRKIKAK
jgi:four helix bundle protein